jgi:tRNA(Arg) A34 adenosine deaminase TadA
MKYPHVEFQLPQWVEDHLASVPTRLPSPEERMDLVIGLARRNVDEHSGGPFGAAVFTADGRLVAPGVNRVVAANCSIQHAEMMALALAQRRLGSFDLGSAADAPYELVASTEPCAMCFGAVPWSGVRRLVCGARDEDARAVGFDEGPKLADWVGQLEARGIEGVRDLRRAAAAAVLQDYAAGGGRIYNPSGG